MWYVYFRGLCAVELELAVCKQFLTIRVRSIRHFSRVYITYHTRVFGSCGYVSDACAIYCTVFLPEWFRV